VARWRWAAAFVWLVALGAQIVLTRASTSRIWYEELAESVRNVYWLADRAVYDGMSSNVGWYGLLLLVYRTSGFSLHAAKIVRLVLAGVSLACAIDLLVRMTDGRRAIVPALAFTLSPMLLYFNTFQTSYGVDLQLAPIVAWFGAAARFDDSSRDRARHALIGAIVGIGALMWPVLLLYVPAFIVYAIARVRASSRPAPVAAWSIAAAAALAPFAAALVYLRTRGIWLNDASVHSGVFRGGGGTVVVSASRAAANARLLVHELFTGSHSYSSDLVRADFSGVVGIVPFVAVAALVLVVWRSDRASRVLIASALTLLAVNVAAAVLASGVPGLRRDTGCVAAFYVLFAICWRFVTGPDARFGAWRSIAAAALALLVVHHAVVYRANDTAVADPARAETVAWFVTEPSPSESLERWVRAVRLGTVLDCGTLRVAARCRYPEIFAAIAGASEWNDRENVTVRASDPSGAIVTLTRQSWPPGAPQR
jgi:hypothetical protein